jgi:adenylate cyclase
MGDGSLIEFPSAVNAVACALAIQRAIDAGAEIRYRIGVNLGDVIVEDNDIYGEGVNVAARLQTLAPVGGVAISKTVHDHIAGRIEVVFDDLGPRVAKSGERPIHVFAYSISANPVRPEARPDAGGKPATRISVLVLPFANMSGDAEQEYFSDGITEDIITDLSKVSALSVIARNTAFTFKGKAVEVTQVARQTGVSHVLEGSVRKAGNRVRITGQLIDGSSGNHVWAERYDRDLDDIFALQDDISRAIVDALKINLLGNERPSSGERGTTNVEAYQYYLMGRHHYRRGGRQNNLTARRLFQKAIEIEPGYAQAYAALAIVESLLLHINDPAVSLESLLAATDRALTLNDRLAEPHAAKAFALLAQGNYQAAIAAAKHAASLDPDLPEAYHALGNALRLAKQYAEAAASYERLAILAPDNFHSLGMAIDCYRSTGSEVEARDAARRAMQRLEKTIALHPDDAMTLAMGTNLWGDLGQIEKARAWAKRALDLDPDDYIVHYNIACFHAGIGELEQAIDILEFCVPHLRAIQFHWMQQDSGMDPLREHPRFKALMERAGKIFEPTPAPKTS